MDHERRTQEKQSESKTVQTLEERDRAPAESTAEETAHKNEFFLVFLFEYLNILKSRYIKSCFLRNASK